MGDKKVSFGRGLTICVFDAVLHLSTLTSGHGRETCKGGNLKGRRLRFLTFFPSPSNQKGLQYEQYSPGHMGSPSSHRFYNRGSGLDFVDKALALAPSFSLPRFVVFGGSKKEVVFCTLYDTIAKSV